MFALYLQNMWIERTIYVTAYKLPGILRWFEVKSVFMVRSVCLCWGCIEEWGFYTAREHLYFCVTVLQFWEPAVRVVISATLRQGGLAEDAGYWLRVTRVMLFRSWERENTGWLLRAFRARSDQVFGGLFWSISGSQQVRRCSLWLKRVVGWCTATS